MIKQNEFKWENLEESMVSKYLLYELNINKKFARKQEISWEEIKKAWSPANLQLIKSKENMKKRNKVDLIKYPINYKKCLK